MSKKERVRGLAADRASQDEVIARLVADAPPLTPWQIEMLRRLMGGASIPTPTEKDDRAAVHATRS